jgi:hypothetical protein
MQGDMARKFDVLLAEGHKFLVTLVYEGFTHFLISGGLGWLLAMM